MYVIIERMHLAYQFAPLDCLISSISGGPGVVIFQPCVSFCWVLSSSYSLPDHAHPGIAMIMATFVILAYDDKVEIYAT